MTAQDYISIIVIGFCENRDFLSDFFYRECKSKGQINFISPIEFFTNLKKASDVIVDEIKRHYDARVKDVSIIKGIWGSEGKPTDELEGQIGNLNDFSAHCAGGVYIVNLWYRDLVYIQEEITKAEKQVQSEVNWVKIFQGLDVEKEIPVNAYNISSLKQKEKYFSEATFRLTLEYLLNLKKEIFFLSEKNKLAHLTSRNIPRPELTHSGNDLFDQTCFEAQCNYYDFLEKYKKFLQNATLRPQPETNMADVFISYSWDSDEHNDKVLSFANHLRKNGFDAQLDRNLSQEETAINFVKMMHKAMLDHPKVIVVLSKGYKAKAEVFKGGVGEEYSILLNDIKSNLLKYILVSFEGRGDEITPLGLKGRDIIDLTVKSEETRLFSKLLDQKEIELAPVAPEKPRIAAKVIPEYAANKPDNKSSIEVAGIDFKKLSASLSAGLYNFIEFTLAFDFKNVSSKVVDGFGYEIRISKFLDPASYKKTVEGNLVVYSETVVTKIYPTQTKRSETYSFKLTSENVVRVLGSAISISVFTESGTFEKSYPINEIIKIHSGGQTYGEAVPLDPKFFR